MSPDFPLESVMLIQFEEGDGKTKFTLMYEDVSTISDQDLAGMKQG
ncbi:MAG: hypothetical protein GX112_03205 [Clostridiaceae bacterium]|jgi:hypothetical protein|nr:hypothetical protein [Clostridiaceae bacterium]